MQTLRAREPPREPTPEPRNPQLPYPRPSQSQPEPRKATKRRREQLTPENVDFKGSEKSDVYQFEKRARRKTRDNRYDYKPSGANKPSAGEKERALRASWGNVANGASRTEVVKEQFYTMDGKVAGNPENPTRRLLRSHDARRARAGRGDNRELREFASFFQPDDMGRDTSPWREDNTTNKEHLHRTRSHEESFNPSSVELSQASHDLQDEYASLIETGRGRRDFHYDSTPELPVPDVPAQDKGRQGSVSGSYITWSTSHHEECEKNESEISVSGGEQQSAKPRFERSRLGMKLHSDKDTRVNISHKERVAMEEEPALELYAHGMLHRVIAEPGADRQHPYAQDCWRESVIEMDKHYSPPQYLMPQITHRPQRSTGPSLSAPSQMRLENESIYIAKQHNDEVTRMDIGHKEQAVMDEPALEPYMHIMPHGAIAESTADKLRPCAQDYRRKSPIKMDKDHSPPQYLPQRLQRPQRSRGPSLSTPSQMGLENESTYISRGGLIGNWQPRGLQRFLPKLANPARAGS